MNPDVEAHYKIQLSRKSEFFAIEGQRQVQEVATKAARSGLTGSGIHLAHMLGTYCDWNIRQPVFAMLECYLDSCRALSSDPQEADLDEILREAEESIPRRSEGAKQFVRDYLLRHDTSASPNWSSMAEQAAGRVLSDFRREVGLKKIEARNRHKPQATISDRVFVVHGHDHETRDEICRMLESFGLAPIILGDEPAKGRTLIEKLEQEGAVGFAVVLLTGDDLAYDRRAPDDWRLRARQKVILELGYLVGRHGRAKVIALYEEGVEIPTDYHGVEYIPLSGEWQLRLANELRAAGLPLRDEKPA